MKFLVVVASFAISSISLACTNFSGTYTFPRDSQNTQIIQSGCSTVTLISNGTTLVIPADGSFHEVANQDIIMEGQVLGKVIINSKASFGVTELYIDTKAHIEMMGQIQDDENSAINILMSNGDLQSVTTFKDGHTETAIAKRVN